MKKLELRQLIREEIRKLTEEHYPTSKQVAAALERPKDKGRVDGTLIKTDVLEAFKGIYDSVDKDMKQILDSMNGAKITKFIQNVKKSIK